MGPYSCPVVAIKVDPSEGNPDGVVLINASDFDEATMTQVDVPEAPIVEKTEEVPVDPATTAKVVAPWAAK